MSDLTDDIKSLVAEMPDAPTPDMVVEFPKVTRLPVAWEEPYSNYEETQGAFSIMNTGDSFVVLTVEQALHINDLLGVLVFSGEKPPLEESRKAKESFLPASLIRNMESLAKSLRHNFAIEQQKYPNP
jgi:hypothetical protein